MDSFVNKDLTAARNEYIFTLPPALVPAIHDPRNMPLALALINIALLTLPGAAAVFVVDSHWFGFAFWITNFLVFQGRFLLSLHYFSHETAGGLFKNQTLNFLTPWVLSPFFGVPSGIYFLHHVVMHHCENNLQGWDLSSKIM
jgi:hypothetical protein